MTGHEHLLALRRSGMVPACVWVSDDDTTASIRSARDWHTQPNSVLGKLVAHIRLAADDIPETLDFRPLVGLRVHLVCDRDQARSRRVFRALADAKPSFLIAAHGGEVWTHGGPNGANH